MAKYIIAFISFSLWLAVAVQKAVSSGKICDLTIHGVHDIELNSERIPRCLRRGASNCIIKINQGRCLLYGHYSIRQEKSQIITDTTFFTNEPGYNRNL
ncbi:MAG: hypothetical protein U9Q84_07350 [Thermodesulfobacteriota bacterium]|nr:hypothetical protein [Thermodesulfobacteriota bacterium]